MASFKQYQNPVRQVPLRKMSSVEQTEHQARQLTSNGNNGINLRLLIYCLTILLFTVQICICSEVPSTSQTERYERQTENDTNLYHSGNLPSNESTRSFSDDNSSKKNITCNKGYYLNDTKKECIPCPNNSFMPVDNHIYRECIECRVGPDSHQTIQWQNATHAPIFGCEDGYYKGEFQHHKLGCPGRECDKCKNCSAFNRYERRPCSNDMDADCCEEGMTPAESNSSICIRKATTPSPLPANSTRAEEMIVCDRNYYVDNSSNTCQPCPPNTYSDKDNHTSHSCINCSEVIAQTKPEGCPSVRETSDNDHSGNAIGIVAGFGFGIVVVAIYMFMMGLCSRDKISMLACCRNKKKAEENDPTIFEQTDTGSMVLSEESKARLLEGEES